MAIILQAKAPSTFSSFVEAMPDPMALETGDRVARVENSHQGPVAYFYTVERVTRTQIVLEGGTRRYRRDTGSPVGDSYAQRLYHVGHPHVLAAQQAMAARALVKKVAETLVAKLNDGAARAKACRQVEMFARQAAERIELLERQKEESLAEAAAILEEANR